MDKYLRFVRPIKVEHLNAREGFFCAAYDLRGSEHLDIHTSEHLEDLLDWFRKNVTIPKKFNSSKSKGWRKKNPAGLSWFKENASDAIRRSYELVNLLAEHGYLIETIRTERIGYIIYEDDNQVIAEPFSDTPV